MQATIDLTVQPLLPNGKTPDVANRTGPSFEERLLFVLGDMAGSLHRLADALAPDPGEQVGSDYIAKKLGVTTIYVGQMAREGTIPKNCIIPGTGNGKNWKFHRERIDKWIAAGRPEA